MHVSLLTAFPDFFGDFLETSIIGRALKKGLISVDVVDLRSFGRGPYRQIDDYSFGGGGMVFAAPPLMSALRSVTYQEKPFVVYPSPQGVPLTQELVETLAGLPHVVIVCGHYEGLDERFVEREVDLEFSIGDCILTGGEIPAMALIDSMSRLVSGVVGCGKAVEEDSFFRGMLDHPHYTRPAEWEGMAVPPVLLEGNEKKIARWRRKVAIERTLARRPDLLVRAAIADYLSDGAYLLVDAGKFVSKEDRTALLGFCRCFGLMRPMILTRDPEERSFFSDSVSGSLDLSPKFFGRVEHAVGWVTDRSKGRPPLIVLLKEQWASGVHHMLEVKRRCLEHKGAVVFAFLGCSASSFGENVLSTALFAQEVSLPLTARIAIALDRMLGAK